MIMHHTHTEKRGALVCFCRFCCSWHQSIRNRYGLPCLTEPNGESQHSTIYEQQQQQRQRRKKPAKCEQPLLKHINLLLENAELWWYGEHDGAEPLLRVSILSFFFFFFLLHPTHNLWDASAHTHEACFWETHFNLTRRAQFRVLSSLSST